MPFSDVRTRRGGNKVDEIRHIKHHIGPLVSFRVRTPQRHRDGKRAPLVDPQVTDPVYIVTVFTARFEKK